MARKSAAQPKAPATLPDVLIPPSQADANEREAYWLQLLSEPDELKAAIQTEEFWPMLRDFPDALWTNNRLSLYLYRKEDDAGRMIKNTEGKKKYIRVYHEPVDEEMISQQFGGGKYLLYLKLDTRTELTQHTFAIDGVPKVMPGQVVEVDGKPVSVAGTAQPNPAPTTDTTLDKVIDANSRANESSMEIVTNASKAAIAMVQEQAKNAAAPPADPLATVRTLLELVRPQPNPVQDELMKAIIAKALAPTPAVQTEERETPVDQTLNAIEKLSGGKSLAELMIPSAKAAAADSMASWVPIAQTAGQVALSFFEKLPHLMAQRTEQLRLELQIRQTGGVAPVPANGAAPARLPAPTVIPPTQSIPAQPTAADPHALIQAVVKFICDGFDRDRNEGSEVAAALDVQFGEQMDALGITHMLGQRTEVQTFIDGIPELKQRSQDARWPEFFQDFMQFTEHTYGEEEPEPAGPQAVEAPKPATA